MSRHALDRLVRPRSVAIVGASGDPTRTAGRPAVYLRKHGYAGTLYLVNPRYTSLDGLPCYPDVASLPQTPDVGLVLLGPDRADQAVRDLADRGAAAAIVLTGGYAEVDAAGARRQEDLRAAAGSMRLLARTRLVWSTWPTRRHCRRVSRSSCRPCRSAGSRSSPRAGAFWVRCCRAASRTASASPG